MSKSAETIRISQLKGLISGSDRLRTLYEKEGYPILLLEKEIIDYKHELSDLQDIIAKRKATEKKIIRKWQITKKGIEEIKRISKKRGGLYYEEMVLNSFGHGKSINLDELIKNFKILYPNIAISRIEQSLEELEKDGLIKKEILKMKKIKPKKKKATKPKKVKPKKRSEAIELELRKIKEGSRSEQDLIENLKILKEASTDKSRNVAIESKLSILENNQLYRDEYWEKYFTDEKLIIKETFQKYLLQKLLNSTKDYFPIEVKPFQTIIMDKIEKLMNNEYRFFDQFKMDVYESLGIKKTHKVPKKKHFSRNLGILQFPIVSEGGFTDNLLSNFLDRIWEEIICFQPFFLFEEGQHDFHEKSKQFLTNTYKKQMQQYFPQIPLSLNDIPKKIIENFPPKWHGYFKMPFMNFLGFGFTWYYEWFVNIRGGGISIDKNDELYFNLVDGMASKASYGNVNMTNINIHPLELYVGLNNIKLPNQKVVITPVLPAQTLYHEILHQLQYRRIVFRGFIHHMKNLRDYGKIKLTRAEDDDWIEFENQEPYGINENIAIAEQYDEEVWKPAMAIDFTKLLQTKGKAKGKVMVVESVNETIKNMPRGAHGNKFKIQVRKFSERDKALEERRAFFKHWVVPMYGKYMGKPEIMEKMINRGLWDVNKDEFNVLGYIL